jgi:3-oxoacyl-(acyl-carrier-protein) synthase/SAM-dependent methyltransferase
MSNFLDELRALSPKQLMLLALEQHERLEAADRHEPIAIIGMGCRFPGAQTPEEFWRLLDEGRTAIREVPSDRWENELLFDADRDAPGRIAIRAAGFLDDIAGFDAAFFGIAPREAASMDPQQRLLLEVAWEALENAGVPPDRLANTATGVFVGQCNADYLQRLLWRGDAAIDGYLASGTSPSVTSGRLAYCLGLRGPALTVDTSCSASLVALHLACRSLRSGETRVALAAGVNLMCAPETSIALSKAHMLAPDGRSKAFDAAADGLGRGEGVAVLVLKRLADALADGDPVLAVVRGSAINQDGRSAGLTVPNGPAQEAVIAAALADAGVAAHAIGYVEAHGTGTSLGDPIEVRALANALGAGRSAAQKLLIGSVKSNIGHLEGAAGLAGVIKTVLCLHHARIVRQPLFRIPNPHIPWDEIPVAVAADGGVWPEGKARFAGISSFGFSGTNAHVVLEQGNSVKSMVEQRLIKDPDAARWPVTCLALSARSSASLRALALRYAALLDGGAVLADVASEATLGRAHLPLRLAIVAETSGAASDALRAFAAGQSHPLLLTRTNPADGPHDAPVFFAPDFDPRASLVGRQWYSASAVFREVIDRADALLGPDAAGRRLWAMLGDPHGAPDAARAQAAHVAVQCATVTLWRSFGIVPAAIRGEGVGELSAACLEGRLELEEALRRAIRYVPIADEVPAGLAEKDSVTVFGANAAGCDDWQLLTRTLAAFYVAGATLDWRPLGGTRGKTRLPNYPFDHQRYWVDVARPSRDAAAVETGPPVDGLFYELQWKGLAAVSPAAPALVAPEKFIRALTRQFEALVVRHDLQSYDRLAPLLDRLSALHVATALRALGFDDTPGRVFSLSDEARCLGIAPRHQRLFARMFDFLVDDEVACRVTQGFEMRLRLPLESAQTLRDSFADTLNDASGAFKILARCGGDLAGVLTGARDPLTLLFPGGSFAEASLLYVESPAARVYNGALGAAAVAAVAELPPGARLRVLEIGAGTGGTTETLLPLLPPDLVDYTFTDVSPLFLERAVERFANVRTGLLDIERDPATQGFAAGGYDLVVASNVLHATADLAQTLRHVRGLLAPGGLLLCLEAVAAERWSDLTFGMTEGWWRFTDLVLRPAHALLSADSWRSLLEDTGWTQIYSIGGEPGTMVGRAQQALVIARAPTLARRFTLVGDGDGLAETLAARLRARGDVVSVRDIDDEDADFHGGDLVYLGALQLGAHTSADECAEFACAAAIRWLARFGREPASALPGRAWLVTAGAQAVQGRVTSSGRFQAP